ncbi:hypothetical protein JXB37_02000 [candidate division WOR-3 bacterium]|nr:hypothetical protein [candidate division WOR-3 bacterium]
MTMVQAILLVLLPAQVPAETIAPYNTGYAYTYYQHGQLLYGKGYGNIAYADDDGPRGWASFSLSGIPDTLEVAAAALEYYQYSSYDVPRTSHVSTILDPETADPQTLFIWLSYGASLAHAADHPDTGWKRREFHADGIAVLDSMLGAQRLTVGFCPTRPCGLGRARGADGGAQAPRLILSFRQTGTGETGSVRPEPVARLEPNPARRFVRLLGSRPVTLFAASGQAAARLKPGSNFLSGLAPGVYLAPDAVPARLVILR